MRKDHAYSCPIYSKLPGGGPRTHRFQRTHRNYFSVCGVECDPTERDGCDWAVELAAAQCHCARRCAPKTVRFHGPFIPNSRTAVQPLTTLTTFVTTIFNSGRGTRFRRAPQGRERYRQSARSGRLSWTTSLNPVGASGWCSRFGRGTSADRPRPCPLSSA